MLSGGVVVREVFVILEIKTVFKRIPSRIPEHRSLKNKQFV